MLKTYSLTTTFKQLGQYVKGVMPEGGSLPDEVWQSRHRGILALLWLHTIGIVCFGLFTGAGWQHSLVEGAILAVIAPTSVYNHPDAFAHPWKWAAIHGVFVLAASIASIISWRLNEALRAYSELILNSTGSGQPD